MNTNPPRNARAILISLLIGFAAGATGSAYFLGRYGYLIEKRVAVMPAQFGQLRYGAWMQGRMDGMRTRTQRTTQTQEALSEQPQTQTIPFDEHCNEGVARPIVPESPVTIADDIIQLRRRHLLLPLDNLTKEDLRNSFDELRGNHIHEAIDILAPRNTPILAVEDGTIARLWNSVPGGMTIYLFDPEQKYEYYYAHLESYADGLKEGDRMKRGQVIGYVGTSGNAPKDTPHLHFTIFKLTDNKHWWEGTAVNPYLVYN